MSEPVYWWMRLRRRLAGAAAVAVVAVGCVAATAAASPPSGGEGRAEESRSAVQPRLDLFQGVARPSQEVEMATPLDGILVEVAVEEGQRIEAGTLMGRMDDAMQVATVEAAALRAASVAEIEIRELELAEAEVALERIQQVYSKAAAAEWEVRQARIERDQAGARLKAAREQQALAQVELKLEQTRLDRHRIKAPFAGQVVRVVVEAGAMLTQGSPMLLLANVQPLEAELHLPVSAIGQLQIGRTYPLTAGEPVNATVQGRLKTVDPVFDTASATVRCVFMVDNPGGAMPAGFTVEMLRP